jgi:DNA polymerase III subunit epsilon
MLLFRSPRWDEVEYWALDLETSGLDIRRDEILSVGMVPVRGGAVRWGEHYYSLVRPSSVENLGREAMRVHHILPDELRDAPPLRPVMEEVARRIEGKVLLVHHAPFDVAFLRRAFAGELIWWPKPPVVDTRVLVARVEQRIMELQPYARPLPRGLLELRETFGLPPFEPHHALWDALATAELFLALRARLGATTLRQLRTR